MYPRISVIMPVYNESISELNDSINSILRQTYKRFEFIIIDDNPFNNKIKDYLKKFACRDNRIRLIFNKYMNIGAMRSSNKGVKVARGVFIDRMDADDIASKYKLETQLGFIMDNDLDLVCSNFSIINVNHFVLRKNGYTKRTIISQYRMKKILSHCNIAIGPTLFFRKHAFNKLDGYRNINVEDYDLIVRFLIKGFRVGYQGKSLIYKRLRKNSISYQTSFSQYIVMKTISNYLNKTRFNRVLPLNIIKFNISKITENQLYKFNKFSNFRYSLNNRKNILNIIKFILSIVLSFTVVKWCLWALMNRLYRKIY